MAWLAQSVELFHDLVELRLALANDARGSLLERLLGWDAIEPALFGELFVAGEIEADEQAYFAIGRSGFRRSFCVLRFLLGFGFAFGFGLFSFGSFGGLLLSFRGGLSILLGAFELVLQLFIESKGLLPAFEFVAGKLGFLFVGAKIEEEVCVSHKISLRCRRGQVKLARIVGFTPS